MITKCHLALHGAAANSRPHSLLWVRAPPPPPLAPHDDDKAAAEEEEEEEEEGAGKYASMVVYASGGVVNLASTYECGIGCDRSVSISSVRATLVTRTSDHRASSSGDGDDGGGIDNVARKTLARGENAIDASESRTITSLTYVSYGNDDDDDGRRWDGGGGYADDGRRGDYGIVAAFSDGTVTSWKYVGYDATTGRGRGNDRRGDLWEERVLIGNDATISAATATTTNGHYSPMDLRESVADVSAIALDVGSRRRSTNDVETTDDLWLVATASSRGVFLHGAHSSYSSSSPSNQEDDGNTRGGTTITTVRTRHVSRHAAASVHVQHIRNTTTGVGRGGRRNYDRADGGECYLFAGSASPRSNKIWVYTIAHGAEAPSSSSSSSTTATTTWLSHPLLRVDEPICHGYLAGHQDWITCFSWLDLPPVHGTDDNDNGTSDGRRRDGGSSLLASSGHDAKIRLWKFSTWTNNAPSSSSTLVRDGDMPRTEGVTDDIVEDDEDVFNEVDVDDLEEEEEGEARLTVVHSVAAATAVTAISLDALLLGHEEAVTSISWRRRPGALAGNDGGPCLLSSSMDRTILLWMEEGHSNDGDGGGGVWVPISRVGSAGGILGGPIGASLMGFVDAAFSLDGDRIAGHGYGGSIHFWTRGAHRTGEVVVDGASSEDDRDDCAFMSTARWVADPCITGHFRSVEDMAWDPLGEYLLTTSSDQTTRLWTEVPTTSRTTRRCRWMEVGRPQVHGYDMTSIVCIGGEDDSSDKDGEPRHRFVSGADEKVLRVFDAPASTLRLFRSISRLRDIVANSNDAAPKESSWRSERAFMPSLGLSNKATADTDMESSRFSGPVDDNDLARTLDPVEELRLPSERDLGVTTLWPETGKLFGHESELVCLVSYRAPAGTGESSLVASSCMARNDVASAAIRLWDAKKGKCVGVLKGGHRSTVSTMSFSRDGKYLASSGKDRRICIWRRVTSPTAGLEDFSGYDLSAAADSAHKRIVWSVHFCPKRPDILASGSRDGLIKIWRVAEADDGILDLKELYRFEPSFKGGDKIPVTAVAFAEDVLEGVNGEIDRGILSIGTECGRIEIWSVPVSFSNNMSTLDDDRSSNPCPSLLYTIPSNDSHFDTVKKIVWRPCFASSGVSSGLTFASCGQDGGVRIFNLS